VNIGGVLSLPHLTSRFEIFEVRSKKNSALQSLVLSFSLGDKNGETSFIASAQLMELIFSFNFWRSQSKDISKVSPAQGPC
jgi:uncharacterized transporter YbjL